MPRGGRQQQALHLISQRREHRRQWRALCEQEMTHKRQLIAGMLQQRGSVFGRLYSRKPMQRQTLTFGIIRGLCGAQRIVLRHGRVRVLR